MRIEGVLQVKNEDSQDLTLYRIKVDFQERVSLNGSGPDDGLFVPAERFAVVTGDGRFSFEFADGDGSVRGPWRTAVLGPSGQELTAETSDALPEHVKLAIDAVDRPVPATDPGSRRQVTQRLTGRVL